VGEEVKGTTFSGAQRRDYRRKVQLSLDVFETMLAQSSFDFERPLSGNARLAGATRPIRRS